MTARVGIVLKRGTQPPTLVSSNKGGLSEHETPHIRCPPLRIVCLPM